MSKLEKINANKLLCVFCRLQQRQDDYQNGFLNLAEIASTENSDAPY